MKTVVAFVLLTLCVGLSQQGCLSQIVSTREHANSWIGRPVGQLRTVVLRPESYASGIGWKEKTYHLDNGNWVYVEPDSPGCFIDFEVDPQGTIVGYKFEGKCL